MNPKFFPTPEKFRDWLKKNHLTKTELWVGYYKKDSGKKSINWPESVDQALCFGWIDGIRKSVDDNSYKIRFTPRKPNSHWSKVNINKVKVLQKQGLMFPAGLSAFKKMRKDNSALASYEQRDVELPKPYLAAFKKNKLAWNYWMNETPSYRKQAKWWVVSAKQEETRDRRFMILMTDSENHLRVKPLRPLK